MYSKRWFKTITKAGKEEAESMAEADYFINDFDYYRKILKNIMKAKDPFVDLSTGEQYYLDRYLAKLKESETPPTKGRPS